MNIKVFAESKQIIDNLKNYPALSERIFNRNNLELCDAIMFFDYPADRQLMSTILEQTSANYLHFMNYDIKHISPEDLVKTSIKMLKYAVNYNNGVVELYKFASFLGKSYDVLDLLFALFNKIGLVKIISKDKTTITVSLDETVIPVQILHFEEFTTLVELSEECEEFQTMLLNEPIERISELLQT